MEEKKLDINSIIGFVLIFGILIFWFYQNQPTPEELEAQKAERAQEESQEETNEEPLATVLLETKHRCKGFDRCGDLSQKRQVDLDLLQLRKELRFLKMKSSFWK